jgi:hypothetical protein
VLPSWDSPVNKCGHIVFDSLTIFTLPLFFKGHIDVGYGKGIWVDVFIFCCIFRYAIVDFRSNIFGDLNKEFMGYQCFFLLLLLAITCTTNPITMLLHLEDCIDLDKKEVGRVTLCKS